MLSTSANPDCSTVFRYLHEGKLYVISSTVREKHTSKLSANKIRKTFGLPRSFPETVLLSFHINEGFQ
jgi:hypothetical protein